MHNMQIYIPSHAKNNYQIEKIMLLQYNSTVILLFHNLKQGETLSGAGFKVHK